MEETNYFTGHHELAFHLWGLLFALIGTLVTKRVYWLIRKSKCKALGHNHDFSYKIWIKENWIDTMAAIATTYFIVRFLDFWLDNMKENDIKPFGYNIAEAHDQLVFYLLGAILIQIPYHKWLRPYTEH